MGLDPSPPPLGDGGLRAAHRASVISGIIGFAKKTTTNVSKMVKNLPHGSEAETNAVFNAV